ncbi:MAG: hypothetical protein ACJAYB_000527 [Psychromonas sp.]|jgi:hypothetical protein
MIDKRIQNGKFGYVILAWILASHEHALLLDDSGIFLLPWNNF